MPDIMLPGAPPLVLASGSHTRATILAGVGLVFEVHVAGIDEAAVIDAIGTEGERPSPADIAAILAEVKAVAGSTANTGAIVIGADQTMEFDGELFTKPADMAEARRTLLRLSGRTHLLNSSIAIARNGESIWRHTASVDLTMRTLSREFVGRYSAAAGEAILSSVGCYQLEALGSHLFEKIDGDHFTILGLPLLPLLGELRRLEVIDG